VGGAVVLKRPQIASCQNGKSAGSSWAYHPVWASERRF
jgi:hypothetical protein